MNRKGQFSIIAALLVAIVLVGAVITTYSTIRYSPLQEESQVLSAIDEINLALKQILGFTVGYYGSVLKVTGNTTYARNLSTSYLRSGLNNIGDIRPEWGSSFNVTSLTLSTTWFSNSSFSSGNITVRYDLTGLGVYGVSYAASSRLAVSVFKSNSSSQAALAVFKDGAEPLVNLGRQNFKFYRYVYANSTWELINPTNLTSFADGTYAIDLPSGVTSDSYLIQVEDSRGLLVTASSYSRFSSVLTWDGNYSTIPGENMVVELLQNGTLRSLGQNLNLTQAAKPIPPLPVKALHVTQTINGVTQEVPFQVEDWSSQYQLPLGLSGNTSIVSGKNLIVFQANSQVSKFTVWWNGSDDALQTPLAFRNTFFNDNPGSGRLSNNRLTLQFSGGFDVSSTLGAVTSTSSFMRINSKTPTYGANLAYTIYNGIVRDVITQEAEWGGGITSPACPNVYSQIVLTLPANSTYYTYQLRLMFINSSQSRTITDLNPIRLSSSINQIQTENGTLSGYPVVASGSGTLSNTASPGWTAHHWSQFVSSNQGAGIMFTDLANQRLYAFDSIAGGATGALKADTANRVIELLPVTLRQVQFTYPFDVTWHGAIVNFDNTTPIYKLQSGTPTGLWIIAEYPPTISVTAES